MELCAQIGGGALRKDVVVTVNVSPNTGKSLPWSPQLNLQYPFFIIIFRPFVIFVALPNVFLLPFVFF